MDNGQAAMEFLMTYGWAILVVLAGLALLNYFGMLDLKDQMSNVVIYEAGLSPGEYVFNGSGVYMTIINNFGVPIGNVRVVSNSTSPSDAQCDGEVTVGGLENNEASRLIQICSIGSPPDRNKARYRADLKIYYTKEGENVEHVGTGRMNLRYEG